MKPILSPPLVSIGLVTDLHYAPGVAGTRYYQDSLAKLEHAVASFDSLLLDLLINLGDSIDYCASVEDEVRHFTRIRQTLSGLPVPTHILSGNHDVAELTREQFLAQIPQRLGHSYYSFDCRDVHIILLDTNINSDGSPFSKGNFQWDDTWIGTEQFAWLRADLAAAGDRPALVFCHANLDDRKRPNGTVDGHIVKDAGAVRAVLERSGNVKAIISGHCHQGGDSIIHGIPHIILRAMVEGQGLENNAYSQLSLFADGTVSLKGFAQQPSLLFQPDGKGGVVVTDVIRSIFSIQKPTRNDQ